jgi:hypothetical protein
MIPDALQLCFTKKNKRKTLFYKEKEKEEDITGKRTSKWTLRNNIPIIIYSMNDCITEGEYLICTAIRKTFLIASQSMRIEKLRRSSLYLLNFFPNERADVPVGKEKQIIPTTF